MTSPVPDAFRTQLAEVLAGHVDQITETDDGRFRYGCTCGHVRGVFTEAQAMARLGTRESIAEQRLHVADALLPFLARARVEGAAEALREFESWAQEQAGQRLHNSPVQVGECSGLLMTAMHARKQRAALSASTTTEGDPT